jgi:hypothetical protein
LPDSSSNIHVCKHAHKGGLIISGTEYEKTVKKLNNKGNPGATKQAPIMPLQPLSQKMWNA